MAALAYLVLGTNPWGKRFLEKNRYNEGVTTQPSGLQYKVRRRGGGDAHPLPSTQCDVHYVGRVAKKVDGKRRWTTFDSSRKRGEPLSLSAESAIAGTGEALTLMVEGARWDVWMPSELAYGDDGFGEHIVAGDMLHFDLELVKIDGPARPAAQRAADDHTEIATVKDLRAWAEAGGGPPWVLGVFRQPLYKGKLFNGFVRMSAALRGGDAAAAAAVALHAQARFNATTGAYERSALEEATGVRAPAVYVSMALGDDGLPSGWERCAVAHSRPEVSEAQVQSGLVDCVLHAAMDDPAKDEL